MYKHLYSKFIYPKNFKQFKINRNIELNQINEITDKLNLYQETHFDIYEYVSSTIITNISESDVFIKFIITSNTVNGINIEAFITFYKLDILNINTNKIIRTLYLYYYFANGNIVDYLEYIAEWENY